MRKKSARRLAHELLILLEKATEIETVELEGVEYATLPMQKKDYGRIDEFDRFCKGIGEDFEINIKDSTDNSITPLYYKSFDREKGLMYFSFTPLKDKKISIPET